MVVAGFISMVGLRSVGDAWLPEDNPYWNRVVSFVTKDASQVCHLLLQHASDPS